MVQKMNQDVASFLLKCQPESARSGAPCPGARPPQQPRVQTSKQGVQNLNEQRMAAARLRPDGCRSRVPPACRPRLPQGRAGPGGEEGAPQRALSLRFRQEVQEVPRPLSLPPVAEDTPSFDVLREALGRLEVMPFRPGVACTHRGCFGTAPGSWSCISGPSECTLSSHHGAVVRASLPERAHRQAVGEHSTELRTLQSIRAVEPEVSGFLEERDLFLKALDEVEALQGTVNHGLYGLRG